MFMAHPMGRWEWLQFSISNYVLPPSCPHPCAKHEGHYSGVGGCRATLAFSVDMSVAYGCSGGGKQSWSAVLSGNMQAGGGRKHAMVGQLCSGVHGDDGEYACCGK
jgi:hypothetical protein